VSELAVNQLLDGKYRIVRRVGQGAWATVYEAVNVRIQRRVAIKILNIELTKHPQLLARFSREAAAATQIESPFVVTMFDAGTTESDRRPYIVMEFLEGEDLGRRIKRVGALSQDQAVAYTVHLLSGLADAHATGVLHRDIKPDNLVIVTSKTGQEILKLVDFGISKPNGRPETLPQSKTELILGSPVYMSPEQARGTRHMDHRSDLYSVGVVLFEALTNSVPHVGGNFNELMFKVALETAPDPRTKKPDLDEALAKIVVKALAREPDARFQSAVEFRTVLMEWSERRGTMTAPLHSTSKVRRAAQFDVLNGDSAEEDVVELVRPKDSPSQRNVQAPGSGPVRGATSTRGTTSTTPTSSPASDPRAPLAVAASVAIPLPNDSRKRSVLPLVFGGLGLLLLGGGIATAFTRSSRPAPAAAARVSAPAIVSAAPIASTPLVVPSVAPPIVDPLLSVPVSALPSASVAMPSPKAATPRAGRRSTSPAGATTQPATKPTSPAASNAVVEGRAVRTSF
jgi:eukaryotic-like serine/threonine-protein kinase